MDDIIIFDDFLSIEQQDEIEKQIIVNTLFRWKASYGGVFKLPTKEELGDSRPLALDAPKDGVGSVMKFLMIGFGGVKTQNFKK